MMDDGRELPGGTVVLGLASLAVGFMELAMPEKVQGMLGLEESEKNRGILRVLGIREVVHGVSLLTSGTRGQAAVGLWARVLGDALDTAVLSAAATQTQDAKKFAGTSAMVMGIGGADLVSAVKAMGSG